MKKFIKKISILGIILMTIVLSSEILMRSIREDTIHYYKDQFLMKNKREINTLIMGSSHTCNGIDPSYFSNFTFNMAIPARGLKIDYEILAHYIDDMESLKCVILDISYFSFRCKSFANHDTEAFYRYYNLYMTPKFKSPFEYKFVALDGAFVKTRLSECMNGRSCDTLGFSACVKHNDVDMDATAMGTIRVQTYREPTNVDDNIRYLKEIIDMCQKRSIRLVAVTTPTWHTFYENVNREQYDELLSIMSDLQEKSDIEYYNYISDPRFVEDDLCNGDHLSNIGAAKFSKILTDTLGMKREHREHHN